MSLPLDLILVRHGESEGNLAKARGKVGDESCYDNVNFTHKHTSLFRLTSTGRKQAIAAGEWIKENIGIIDSFYCSEYIRAMETAYYFQIPNANWNVDFMLRERDWGSKEYCSYRERTVFKVAQEVKRQQFFYVPSRGESIAQVCLRLNKILDELRMKCSDRRVILVCHGEVMKGFRVVLEKMTQGVYNSTFSLNRGKDHPNYVNNCQIYHYTRRHPFTGKLYKKFIAFRSTCPWDPKSPSNTGWQLIQIDNQRKSNDALWKIVSSIPRVFDNDSPFPISKNYSLDTFVIPDEYEKKGSTDSSHEDDDDDSDDDDDFDDESNDSDDEKEEEEEEGEKEEKSVANEENKEQEKKEVDVTDVEGELTSPKNPPSKVSKQKEQKKTSDKKKKKRKRKRKVEIEIVEEEEDDDDEEEEEEEEKRKRVESKEEEKEGEEVKNVDEDMKKKKEEEEKGERKVDDDHIEEEGETKKTEKKKKKKIKKLKITGVKVNKVVKKLISNGIIKEKNKEKSKEKYFFV